MSHSVCVLHDELETYCCPACIEEQERERIIKLLENKLSPITYEQHECVSIEDVLAAIKGENK